MPKAAPPITLHYVSPCQASIASLKFFRLRDLPEGFLERALATPAGAAARAAHIGLTCRATRWDIDQRDYVFNGRVGASLLVKSNTGPGEDINQYTEFVPLNGGYSMDDSVDEDHRKDLPRYWKFTYDAPSTKQWLEGMGDMVPAEPPKISEVPADAKKFLARPYEQVSALGRVRIPKGSTGVSNISDDDEANNKEMNTKANSAKFMKLMKVRDGSDYSQSSDEEHSESGDSNESSKETKPKFYSLLRKQEGVHGQSRPMLKANTKCEIPGESPKKDVQGVIESTAQQTVESCRSSSIPDEGFPTYDRRYTRIDKVGLTSVAANQAQWELENLSPPKKKTRRLGISRRQPSQQTQPLSPLPTRGSISAMSLSTGPELLRRRRLPTSSSLTSGGPGSTTIRSYADTDPSAQPWANKTVRATPPSARLIDDTAPVSPVSVKMPPGLQPASGPGRQSRFEHLQISHSAAQKTTGHADTNVNLSQTLIDTSDTEPSSVRPTVKLPPMSKPLQPTTRNAATGSPSSNRHHIEDQIIERVQRAPEDQFVKRNTMRQKARKKRQDHSASSKKKSKAARPKVQLPTPDPVPPPKPKAVSPAEQAASDSPSVSAKPKQKKPTLAKRNSTESFDSDDMDKTGPVENATGIKELFEKILKAENIIGASVEVRFGMILVRHTSNNKDDNREFRKGIYTPQALQARLRGAADDLSTDFFSRLSTAEADAQFLLNLIPLPTVQATVEYKIHIKNPEGNLRVVRFDQTSTNDFVVLHSNTELGTMYLHYPVRVWDAQAIVDRPEMDEAMMALVGAFVSTMQTVEEAPSFRAMVPLDSFTVERVFAKRTLTKRDSDGIELRVTEVQDLLLESINAPRYNFKATALGKEQMMDEQRLWWECSLHTDNVEPDAGEKLQGLVDEIVCKIDVVGFENKGPWVRSEIEEVDSSVVPETPFW